MSRLEGFEREVRQPWKRGWYTGVVIAEYDSEGGDKSFTFRTEDRTTQSVESRQVQLCIGLVNNGEVRNFNYGVFYRPANLFDPTYVAEVLKEAAKKVRGRWQDTGMQRDYLSFVALHDIETALNGGKELEAAEAGGLEVEALIGKQVDAFYSLYKKGDKYTEEVDIKTIKEYEAEKIEWEKGWFGGIKYIRSSEGAPAKSSKARA